MTSDESRLLIHTSDVPEAAAPAPRVKKRARVKTRLRFQERLLRNSCIACATLLGILALGSLNQPWARRASESIHQALTMEIDLDQSLGQLSFVQKLMPESALVFFNLSGDSELLPPTQGSLSHAYSPSQPWLMFSCQEGSPVCAPADGAVSAVSELSDGSFALLIDHGDGLESVIACLKEVGVRTGDKLIRGAAIGTASTSLFFELRQGGQSCDPTQKLGL